MTLVEILNAFRVALENDDKPAMHRLLSAIRRKKKRLTPAAEEMWRMTK